MTLSLKFLNFLAMKNLKSGAKIEIEFDELLRERQEVLLRLNQRILDGYRKLAKKSGLRSGEDLMKIVLSRYVRNHLEDF